MRLTKKISTLLLGIWLVLTGLSAFIHLNFSGFGTLMALLALAAGALILLDR
jgi:hypothetical protein